jgi:NADPH:quinone reductase-like Zn-dependent oxidoreductase
MNAIVHERYGRPDVLVLRDVDKPVPEADQVLVRIVASSVNPIEWYGVTGLLLVRIGDGLRRPKTTTVGADLAGRVEAVGSDVEDLRPGDDVFGTGAGAWAEYAVARRARLVPKPAGVSFEDAAAAPIAGSTALQALRDHGNVKRGESVLINGASGGVGTYAIQLAKWLGAEVTAVCSTRNVEQAEALGADHVVDYTREDFTKRAERHDLMLDIAGSRSFFEYRRVLTPEATVVQVGGPMTYRRMGPLPHIGATFLKAKGRSQRVKFFSAKINTDDLAVLAELLDAGTVKSVVERRYDLGRAPEALAYLGEGHARGKVVITP